MKGRNERLLDGCLVALGSLAASSWALHLPAQTQDEIVVLLYAELISNGRVPNEDFFTPYGPGTFWPLALLFELLGEPSLAVARGLALTYHVVLALGVWALACHFGRVPGLMAGVLSGILVGALELVVYGWVAALSATVWCLAACLRGKPFMAGVLAAIACTVRLEFVLVVVPLLVVVGRPGSIRRLASGLLLGAVPLAVHTGVAGKELFRNVFVDRLAVDVRPPISGTPAWLWAGLVVIALSAAALTWIAIQRRRREDLAIALLVMLLLPQVLQRIDREHFLFVAVAAMPLGLAALTASLSSEGRFPLLPVRAMVRFGAVAVILLGLFAYSAMPRAHQMVVGNRTLLVVSAEEAAAIDDAIDTIDQHREASDQVLLGVENMRRPGVTPVYLYFLRPEWVPEAYFLEYAPGFTETSGSPLLRDLERANMLALNSFPRELSERLFGDRMGSALADAYVDKHFCRAAGTPWLNVYRRCATGSAG